MAELQWILLYVHLVANLTWIGSILAVALVLSVDVATVRERGAIAYRVYQKLASPAFGISFLAGASRLLLDTPYYFTQTKFMHAKLTLALGVIVIHHVLGVWAKQLSRGEREKPVAAGRLALALVGLVAGVVFFVLRKPF